MSYIIIILLSNIVIIVGNALCTPAQTIAAVSRLTTASILATVAVIAVDGITAFVVRRLPQQWFSPRCMVMRVSEKERHFYRQIGIKRWKEHVPELGGFTGFHKDHVAAPEDPQYLMRFLLEVNYGVIIHAVNIVCGFIILLLPHFPVGITLPVATVNAILTGAPIAVLRYNLPVLRRLYERAVRKAVEM